MELLEALINVEEITRTAGKIYINKALGPDGLPIETRITFGDI